MGLFLQGLKLSDGSTLDVSQASEQTKSAKDSAPDFVDRRQQRNRLDRRKTRNPVFEARARRVGMTLDRRQPRSGVIALFSTKFGAEADPNLASKATLARPGVRVGKHRGWGPALLELCASWWRSKQERRMAARMASVETDPQTDALTESGHLHLSEQASSSN